MAAVVALAFVAAGCRQEVAAPKKKDTYVIGVIAKSVGNPVFQAAKKGAMDAAADLSHKYGITVKIDWQTPENEDALQQGLLIKQLANKGVDGITISCSDPSKVTDAINEAVDKGVLVMCFDSDAPDSKRFCRTGIDDVECGKMVMRELAALMGEKGVVAVLAGNENATNLRRRVDGVKEELRKYPNMTLKDVYYHIETPHDAAAKVQEVQRANADIGGWAMVGGWPLFTEKPLPWEPGTVKCVAVDALPAELEHLRNGRVQMLLHQPVWEWGYRSVEILIDKLYNKKDPPSVQDITQLKRITREDVDEHAKNWDKWLPK